MQKFMQNKTARRVVVSVFFVAVLVIFVVCMAVIDNSIKLSQDAPFLNFACFDRTSSVFRFRLFSLSASVFVLPYFVFSQIKIIVKSIYIAFVLFFTTIF